MAANRNFAPLAFVDFTRTVAEMTGQHDDFSDDQFGDAASVGKRCIEHRHATLGCMAQCDLIGADAKRTDGKQAVAGVEYGRRDLGFAANAEHMDIVHPCD